MSGQSKIQNIIRKKKHVSFFDHGELPPRPILATAVILLKLLILFSKRGQRCFAPFN
jgi:hypothetical protein